MTRRPSLKTKRLLLRPFAPSDGTAVRELAGDRAIADTTRNVPHPYEPGMAEEWIATHERDFDEGRCIHFAITENAGGRLVGAIGLMDLVKGHQAELGYWVGKPFWNRGYCTEAAEAVLRFAYEELDLVRVHASHLTRNPASGRVLRKIGMKHEGCRRGHFVKWGRLEDIELYGIVNRPDVDGE